MNTYLKNTLLAMSVSCASSAALGQLSLEPISSVRNGDATAVFDKSAAEIVQYDHFTKQMYVVNGAIDSIDIFDVSEPLSPVLVRSVDLSEYGNPNSVDVSPSWWRGEIAVAVGAHDPTERGVVVFLNKDGDIKRSVTVGYLPDMLKYDPRGLNVVVANEGEPNDDYSVDPDGSVSIISMYGRNRYQAVEIDLNVLTEADVEGVRISGPEGTTIAQDLEPEYVAIDSAGRYAYVVCQENNAMLKIDIRRKQLADVFGLGSKNHAELGNALDASDKDDMIRIANWPVKGLYMPDSIEAYTVDRQTYIVTANEGDGREYDGYEDETRVKNLELDPSAFPLADTLQLEENLGTLKILNTEGDFDHDGVYEALYSMGGRSFSIFSSEGELVYDSGDFIESYIAENYPETFNTDNDDNDSFDGRSDGKGPEPEALTVGSISGRTYVFLGLERVGGVMTFDITDPLQVEFVDYINNRDYQGDPELGLAGDLGPEGLEFIPARKSPNGMPLLLVANEVSGTTTVYEIKVD